MKLGLANLTTYLGIFLANVFCLTALAQNNTPGSIPDGDWRTINRDLAATRYSPLDQINTDNVSNLTQAWTYSLGALSTAVPLVINGVMYLPAGDRIVALDSDSGEELWVYRPEQAGEETVGISTRGVGYWPGTEELSARIFFLARSNLYAVDAASGLGITDFGTNGVVDVGVPYGGAPTIHENVLIIGAAVNEIPQGPPGNPRAFDVISGDKLWEFQTVPLEGEPYNETWGDGWKDRSGTNMWGFSAAIDAQRDIVYLPIAGPAANYWGGDRPGFNVFANSIVAVNAQSGEYLWHFQTVHHDIWDSDMPSVGGLFEVEKDGERVPVIAHVGKTSYLFVLNRENGVPVIEVEERPVPKGDVPGEWYSPTQPFPVKPPPLSRVSFTRDDIVTADDTSAEHAAACQEVFDKSGGLQNNGPFTPFRYKAADAEPKSTIQFPGGTGGVNWGGLTVNPTNGMIYVNSHDTSLVGWTEEREPGVDYSFESVGSNQAFDRAYINGKGPFHSFNAPLSGKYRENGSADGPSLPCQKPPWAKLVAIDSNTGEIVWESPLGINEALPADKQLTGNSGSAGPTVTAGGLVFVGATNDSRFRAFSASTGEQLWESKLQTNANANPMSYTGSSGKQHVAIVAGNTVMVYALP